MKQAPKGEENLLYNAQSFKLGVPGEPVGHFVETVDGKKKFKFYKQSKKALGLKVPNYSKGKKSIGKKSRKVRK